jgi:hypothetical protein
MVSDSVTGTLQKAKSLDPNRFKVLWRGSRSTAYVVDCAQIRPDLSIVPFWPAFVRVVKAVEPLPQQ